MAVVLNAPFSWQTATGDMKTVLEGLQPNILKGHTREFLTVLFIQFDTAIAGRKLLKSLVSVSGKPLVKSALTHLQEVLAFNTARRSGRPNPPSGTPYVGVGITKAGYDLLGVAQALQPKDAAFQAGMKKSLLDDPPLAQWETVYQANFHAVLLIGDAAFRPQDAARKRVEKLVSKTAGVHVAGRQEGNSLHNKNRDGIEHFGYVDGRSQPLFLTEDLEHEEFECDGIANWDPGFAPSRAIVPDRAAPNPALQFGSYFVFRKLEQDVHKFKIAEEAFAKKLDLKGDDVERAGAMIVGRFEDGTPVTSQRADGAHRPVQNNFNYDSDSKGGKCPFFGHIRKMNPRGSGGFESVADERLHIMARRGQTYGIRTDDPNDSRVFNKPKDSVGLLFMAFNADLRQQFEFVQKNWANNAGFPAAPNPPGLDMVIGQGPRPNVSCNVKWGEKDSPPINVPAVPQCVTMKGGEYFFMPSLPFLASL